MGLQISLFLLLLMFLIGQWLFVRRQRLPLAWRILQGDIPAALLTAEPTPSVQTSDEVQFSLPPAIGPGDAAASPPTGVRPALRALSNQGDRYLLPVGWYVHEDQLELAQGSLDGRSPISFTHTLLTGQSGSGKDNLAVFWALVLTSRNSPEKFQLAIVDGKGLDWAAWEKKSHMWRPPALAPEEIPEALTALTDERRRRANILRTAGVTRWEEYTGTDLPLLWVFISELSLLEDALGSTKLASWLNAELAAARAFGIRYIIGTQTASNFNTRWRSQISLFIAGYQPSPSQDEPNTGLRTKELIDMGAIPPSDLPVPGSESGYFTIVWGGKGRTVRAPLVPTHERRLMLEQLPDQVEQAQNSMQNTVTVQNTLEPVLPILMRSERSEVERETPHLEANQAIIEPAKTAERKTTEQPIVVSEDEQRRIIEAAKQGKSRRLILQEVYGGSGHQYPKVRAVLEAAGM